MIISNKMKNELLNLKEDADKILENNSLTDLQLENYFRNLEKHRYIMLNEMRIYNQSVDFEYEKIKIIDNEYKAELIKDTLKIYVPEVMPSYKSITHAHKRILLNIAEITKPFANLFNDEVFIYIKIFNNVLGWDVDNKFVKPVADGLILSKVIKDDNLSKMFYCVKGEFSEIPHTEIYVRNGKNIQNFDL